MNAALLMPATHLFRLAVLSLSCFVSFAAARNLDIPPAPLTATRTVEPKIMYQIDDSGSMMWDIMPDSYMPKGSPSGYLFPPSNNNVVYGGSNYASLNQYYMPAQSGLNIYEVFLRASNNNAVYYNPLQTYKPWVNADGSVYAPQGRYDDPESASFNPAYQWADVINLTRRQSLWGRWYTKNSLHSVGNPSFCQTHDACDWTDTRDVMTRQSYWPMTFYVYKGTGSAQDRKSYIRYQIQGSKAYRTDLAQVNSQQDDVGTEIDQFPWGRSVEDEARNFAIWFQYYRSRILAAKASTALAFSELGSEYRVGFVTINRDRNSYLPVPISGGFIGQNRTDFFDSLLNLQLYQKGTPLRSALQWSGENFKNNYWNDGVSCRRAFSILTTDGYWSDETINVGNTDNFSDAPYPDAHSNTLADVAMQYWKNDLNTSLPNNVRPTTQNPATWQHMTTFSLSLGLKGTLDPVADLPLLAAGSKNWPAPNSAEINKIDDLLHAAVNTRGRFVAAANPDEFRKGLLDALNEITQMSGSQAAGGMSQQVYSDGALYFQAGFDSDNWTGSLRAFKLAKAGSTVTVGAQQWNAADKLSKGKSRVILMGGGGAGSQARPFSWVDLKAAGLASNLDSSLVDYLRGSGDLEGNSGYRQRTTLLGDIIGSAPVYVGAPSDKIKAAQDRPAMVYVGANDGMLHAFDASTGEERFAYIPSLLLPRLRNLSQQNYKDQHSYYVDGGLSVTEAVNQTDKTVATYLAGTLGRGGEAMFLLDITQPAQVTEDLSAARKLVRWEFGSQHSEHMGKQHGLTPQIVRLNDGQDYVLAPNGYNSKQGSASLFILPVKSGISSWGEGNNYWRLQAASGGGNGLSDLATYDLDNNGTIDLVYAGDLLGNVWKFDLSAKQPADWAKASPVLLYRALGPNGQVQPIMSAPVVAPHPDYPQTTVTVSRPGLMVYVGTGRYLDNCDKLGGSCQGEDSQQSIYGLWDYGGRICQRKELLAQYLTDITLTGAEAGAYRQGSDNKLVYPPAAIINSPCDENGRARTAVKTVRPDGSTDKLYPFPVFDKPQAERDAAGSYWLGWYIDLPTSGERVVGGLDYYKKRLEVQTYIPAAPATNACEVGKDSGYLLRLNYRTGGVFAKPRFDDPLVKSALGSQTNASRIVGKRTAGSLGRARIRTGSRVSLGLSLTSGGTGGELDEVLNRVVSRVSWREIITP
jgi:type IV pilus assembly protein PilY1